MTLRKLYPLSWFNQEDREALPGLRRHESTPRDAFHIEVDRMFDNFFNSVFSGLPTLPGRADGEVILKPRLDLSATDKEYEITIELPGVDEKDVDIEVKANSLVISGEKKQEIEESDEKKGIFRIERSYGSFNRTLALPEDSNIDGITARFDKGVLRIAVPRAEVKEDTRKIEIS